MVVYRSAITGKFVSKEYAIAHPDVTVRHEYEIDASRKEEEKSDFQKRIEDRQRNAMEERARHG